MENVLKSVKFINHDLTNGSPQKTKNTNHFNPEKHE